ncbi:MAG: iron-sulfur cluster assembly scaffold protein [Herpetosiphonaceae bacterium]|nr:MAG: iron-sulfur cluster assembly scaffold protein [Herpetosiphonaceae bacterium]
MDRQEAIEFLLEHYEAPRNKGPLPDADVVLPGGNPGCGDVVTIYLKVNRHQDAVERVSFEGEGCTISQAAASILTELAQEKPLSEIEGMDYNDMIDILGREVVQSRPRCATLALGTIKAAIKKYRRDRIREELGEGAPVEDVPERFEI